LDDYDGEELAKYSGIEAPCSYVALPRGPHNTASSAVKQIGFESKMYMENHVLITLSL
jgi:hypothetical protein